MCVNMVTKPSIFSNNFVWYFHNLHDLDLFIEDYGNEIVKIVTLEIADCAKLSQPIV